MAAAPPRALACCKTLANSYYYSDDASTTTTTRTEAHRAAYDDAHGGAHRLHRSRRGIMTNDTADGAAQEFLAWLNKNGADTSLD